MKKKAVTLIELLLATSISSVIILSLYSAFNTGLLSYRQIDSSLTNFEALRLAFARAENDLRNSFPYSAADSMFKGNASGADFFSLSAGLLRAEYFLENETLVRVTSQNLETLEGQGQKQKQVLLNSVKEINFEYAFATQNPDKPYDWQAYWPKEGDSAQQKTLPLAAKIKISLNVKGGKKGELAVVEFNKLIWLPASEYSRELFSGGP